MVDRRKGPQGMDLIAKEAKNPLSELGRSGQLLAKILRGPTRKGCCSRKPFGFK
jgi:hypothetical protein